MVEQKEFAIIFRVERNESKEYQYLIPYDVIEGKYNKEINGFIVNENILYKHITDIDNPFAAAYGCRMIIKNTKNSISENSIKQIINDMLDNANKYIYVRKKDGTVSIMDKETEELSTFEDIDTYNQNKQEDNFENSKQVKDKSNKINMIPGEIVEKIKRSIKGQEEAIIKIVTALWINTNFLNIPKKNMLIKGQTGVGKTAIFEKLKDILDIPLTIFPIPGLSQAGYTGGSTDDILRQIYMDCDCDIERAESSIVVLDEIDKLAYKNENDGSVSTIGVQNELLKIIEGCQKSFKFVEGEYPITIDTTNIIFVGTGAFQELYEKNNKTIGFIQNKVSNSKINSDALQKYGLKRELIGRLPVVVELNDLTREILREIILTSDESELNAYIEALNTLEVEVTNIDEVIESIIDDAMNRKIGARGLSGTINNIFERIFYEIANNPDKYNKVIIGKNIINDSSDFELIEIETKKRVRIKKESKGSEV